MPSLALEQKVLTIHGLALGAVFKVIFHLLQRFCTSLNHAIIVGHEKQKKYVATAKKCGLATFTDFNLSNFKL